MNSGPPQELRVLLTIDSKIKLSVSTSARMIHGVYLQSYTEYCKKGDPVKTGNQPKTFRRTNVRINVYEKQMKLLKFILYIQQNLKTIPGKGRSSYLQLLYNQPSITGISSCWKILTGILIKLSTHRDKCTKRQNRDNILTL